MLEKQMPRLESRDRTCKKRHWVPTKQYCYYCTGDIEDQFKRLNQLWSVLGLHEWLGEAVPGNETSEAWLSTTEGRAVCLEYTKAWERVCWRALDKTLLITRLPGAQKWEVSVLETAEHDSTGETNVTLKRNLPKRKPHNFKEARRPG